jgi:hypothetical protein
VVVVVLEVQMELQVQAAVEQEILELLELKTLVAVAAEPLGLKAMVVLVVQAL